jgi:hypothetical protein
MHPDDLVTEMLKSAGTRTRKSLEAVHATCREQFERGSKDFSIPTISRLANSRGGPTAGAIRNKTGDHYKALIKAWATHTGGSARKMPKMSEDPVMALVQKIESPEVRSIMAAMLAENRKLRREVNLLKHAASKTNYLDLREASTPQPAVPVEVLLAAPTGMTDSEIAALRNAISPEKLAEEGWGLDPSGYITNSNGRPIFKIGFVSAINKVLASRKD